MHFLALVYLCVYFGPSGLLRLSLLLAQKFLHSLRLLVTVHFSGTFYTAF